MANKLDAFEKNIKHAAEGYEVPYSADAAWKQMETKMPPSTSGYKWWYGALSMLAVLPFGVWYFSNNNIVEETPSAQQEAIIAEVIQTETEKSPVVESTYEKATVAISSSEEVVTENPSSSVENQDQPKDEIETVTQNQEAISTDEGKATPVSTPTNESHPLKGTPEDDANTAIGAQLIIQLSKSRICPNGTCLGTYNANELKGQTVVWNLPNGEMKFGDSVMLEFKESGVHIITAQLQDNNAVVSNPVEIEVTPKPNAQFTMNYDVVDGGVPVVNFEAQSDAHKLYKWRFGDGTQTNGKEAQHVYSQSRDYPVQLMVVDQNGCIWTSHNRAEINERFNLFAPNSFTPNADGLNDYWLPKALESDYFKFHLEVFDRSGNLVFETSTPEKQWDGRVKGNLAAQGETFGWKCKTTDPKGIVQYYSGNITIMH